MALLTQLVAAGPAIWDGAAKVWDIAQKSAAHASTFWAGAGEDCRHAIITSTSVCFGYSPARYSPGFRPFSLAWGWMMFGFVTGWLFALHSETLAKIAGQMLVNVWNHRRSCPRPAWHSAVEAALAMQTAEGPRRLVLQRLLDDGDHALQLMAATAGVSPRVALGRALGDNLVQNNAAHWGL